MLIYALTKMIRILWFFVRLPFLPIIAYLRMVKGFASAIIATPDRSEQKLNRSIQSKEPLCLLVALSMLGVPLLGGCSTKKSTSLAAWESNLRALEASSPPIVSVDQNQKLITISVESCPVSDLLRLLSREASVSLVASAKVMQQTATLQLKSIRVVDALHALARQLGTSVIKQGPTLYVFGEVHPEDRQIYVRYFSRLDREQLTALITPAISDMGKLYVTDDSVVVIADRNEVIVKLSQMLDEVEAAPTGCWFAQIHVIDLTDTLSHDLGMDTPAALTLAAASGLGPGVAMASPHLSVALNTLIKASHVDNRVKIKTSPVIVCRDNVTATLNDGVTVRIPTSVIGRDGAVVKSGFEAIQTGLQLSLNIRRIQDGQAHVHLHYASTEIVGFDDTLPRTSGTDYDTAATVSAGGLYLLGQVNRISQTDATNLGLQLSNKSETANHVVQFWLSLQRAQASIVEPTLVGSERASDGGGGVSSNKKDDY